ncbi:MAG: enoyl-CoA hydratase-related protein [SAR86 cluster bacterium]|nr:enoyl-CoA hydratase-related protein [SAR86 cluster bacterium]
MYETIIYEKKDEVALITLNKPKKLNAWTPFMAEELTLAIRKANDDASIGAIVMTGAGKGFCAGADIDETFKTRIDGKDPGKDTQSGHGGMPKDVDWVNLIRDSKPMIAAVNGAAVGIGITMILPFDIIMASERAKFGMFFIKMGLVPELASSYFLVQRMGFGGASEACLSGRLIEAKEALNSGLIDFMTVEHDLISEALIKAKLISENPSPQLRMVKQLLSQNGSEIDLDLVQDRESKLLRECWKTPEHKEAVKKFLNN